MSEPVQSMALGKTDGEWIITQFSNERLQIRLYGDSKGRRTEIWIKGNLDKVDKNE